MMCPGDLELARALTAGADPELAAHVAACPRCRATWDQTQAAIELARELPIALPPPARREELRTALLAGTYMPRRPARRAWLVPAIAIAAAAGLVGYLALPREDAGRRIAGHRHGTVHPQPGARYLVGPSAPDEIVVLSDGAIDIEVAPLHAGERYRVVIGGAEVEVHGTAFTVTARAAHLVSVTVRHGRVDVRPELGAARTLGAGQSWHAELAAAPVEPPVVVAVAPPLERPIRPIRPTGPPARPRTTAPPRAPQPTIVPQAATAPPPEALPAPVAPSAAGRAPEEISYDDAWRALRANNFARAASGFSRVLLLAPDSPLVEDASFWHAVALARAGRNAEALSAFRDFLAGFARSARAGEASAMLGWILIDSRDYDEAARRFRAAASDANPAVRASAQAGLDALARRTPARSPR
jgi:hypothetical protein